ncbi:hypothetical protein C2G38_2099334 [Gigaspora rosea]|uniref:Uncharacterized protein n=1 Tax=Gigaspora rosea TaxID=44941 RepID=A0A397UWD0_9GLOM|nr:hypothetical protein C2G38_2099334 [Gigaspora rosea]
MCTYLVIENTLMEGLLFIIFPTIIICCIKMRIKFENSIFKISLFRAYTIRNLGLKHIYCKFVNALILSIFFHRSSCSPECITGFILMDNRMFYIVTKLIMVEILGLTIIINRHFGI